MTVTVTWDVPRLGTGRIRRSWRKLRELARASGAAMIRPHKTALVNLTRMPLTVAAFGCADAAFYTWHLFPGLIATAVSLFWIEHLIADEE